MFSGLTQSHIHKVTYLSCPLPGHSEQPLSRVCLDPHCPGRSLICQSCQQLKHRSHSTTPLNDFLSLLLNIQNQHKSRSHALHLDIRNLEEAKTTHKDYILKVRAEIDRCLNELEIKTSARFDLLQKEVDTYADKYLEMAPPTFKMWDSDADPQHIVRQFEGALQKFHSGKVEEAKMYSRVSDEVNRSISEIERMKKMLVEACAKIEEASQAVDLLSISLEMTVGKMSEPSFHPSSQPSKHTGIFDPPASDWSSTHHHSDIHISKSVATRIHPSFCGEVGILGSWRLNEGPSLKRSWKFKVLQKSDRMYLGMCLASKMERDCFRYQKGNGLYLVQAGIQGHQKHENYQFEAGDLIQVEYDRSFNKLHLHRNGQNELVMDVESPPKGHFYHPCAYLYVGRDSVEFIR